MTHCERIPLAAAGEEGIKENENRSVRRLLQWSRQETVGDLGYSSSGGGEGIGDMLSEGTVSRIR